MEMLKVKHLFLIKNKKLTIKIKFVSHKVSEDSSGALQPCVLLRISKFTYFFVNPYIDYNLLNWGMTAPSHLNPINLEFKKLWVF